LKSKHNLELPGRVLALHRDRKLSVSGLFRGDGTKADQTVQHSKRDIRAAMIP
jgi:hypothetical protein